jgi:hypothetical protein
LRLFEGAFRMYFQSAIYQSSQQKISTLFYADTKNLLGTCKVNFFEFSQHLILALIENTRCDHGYSHSSQVVRDFLEILTEFTPEERRKFLLFVTGSPRLPIGGFKSLEPKLTIVRKEQGNDDPDTVLPSVNCCFYYLKLPVYSSKKKLKEKLMFAIEHGQGSFSFN